MSGHLNTSINVEADLLLYGNYIRSDSNLTIEHTDQTGESKSVLLKDYFDFSPNLVTTKGSIIKGDIVNLLAVNSTPIDNSKVAFDDPAAIGKITITDSTVVVQRNNIKIELNQGDFIYINDIIEAKTGTVGIVFADETTLSVDAGSRMVVDEFVYDPGNTGSINLNVLTGNFSYISGEVSKLGGDVNIVTPTATLTVQGTMVTGKVAQEGEESQFVLLPNADGTVGQILITNQSGSVLLTEAFQSTSIASAFMPPTVPVIIPEEIVLKQFGTTINTIQKTKKLAKQEAEEEEAEDPFDDEVSEEELEEMEKELEEETEDVTIETDDGDDPFEEDPTDEEEDNDDTKVSTGNDDDDTDDNEGTDDNNDTDDNTDDDTDEDTTEENTYVPPTTTNPTTNPGGGEDDGVGGGTTTEEDDDDEGEDDTNNNPWIPEDDEEDEPETNEAPTFNTTSTVSLAENVSSSSDVVTMSATDPNNDTLTYSIVSGNDAGKFAINSSTGAITTAASLDYETTSSYTLVIAASDGTLTTTTSKTINITDTTDQYTVSPNSGTVATWGSRFSTDAVINNQWAESKAMFTYNNSSVNTVLNNLGYSRDQNNSWDNSTTTLSNYTNIKNWSQYEIVLDWGWNSQTLNNPIWYDYLRSGGNIVHSGEWFQDNEFGLKTHVQIEEFAAKIDSDAEQDNTNLIIDGDTRYESITGASQFSTSTEEHNIPTAYNVSTWGKNGSTAETSGQADTITRGDGLAAAGTFDIDYAGDGDLFAISVHDTTRGPVMEWDSSDSDAEYFGVYAGWLDSNTSYSNNDMRQMYDLMAWLGIEAENQTFGITTDTENLPIGGLTTTYGWTNTNNNTKSSVEAYNLGNNIYIGGGFEHLDLVWDDSGTLTVGQYINGASTGFNVTSTAGSSPRGITFNDDGTKLYLIETVNSEKVHEYNLSTAWDTTTQSDAESDLNLSVYVGTPHSMVFNTDGTKMFISDTTGADIEELTLSTAYDVSTASIDTNDRFNVDQDSSPKGLAFNTDGTKMFVTGDANDKIYEYTLSTGWDVSTASYVDALDVSSQDNDVEGLSFTANGTRMLMAGGQNDKWYEWSLSTGYDISTATYKSSLGTADSDPQDIFFKSDGSKMFTSGDGSNTIRQFQTFMGVSADKAYVAVNSDMDGANSSDAPTIADDHYLIITADTDGDGNLYEQGDVFDLDKIFIVDDSEDFLTQDDDVVTTNSSTGVDYLSGNTYFKITPVTYANSTWNVETDNTVTLANTTNYNDYLDLTSNTDFDDINYAIIETESVLISEVVASY